MARKATRLLPHKRIHPGVVVSLSFEYETRGIAADATLRVITQRYSMLPGDVVELEQEGPGSGKWLVKEVRRSLYSQVADVALTRKRPKLPEPAPPQAAAANEAGAISLGTSGELAATRRQGLPSRAASDVVRVAVPAHATHARRAPAERRLLAGVSWCLLKAGVPLPGGVSWGKWAPVSGNFTLLGAAAGRGQRVTVWTNSGHIWIQFHGFTSGGLTRAAARAGKLHGTPRSTGGFVARHWAGT